MNNISYFTYKCHGMLCAFQKHLLSNPSNLGCCLVNSVPLGNTKHSFGILLVVLIRHYTKRVVFRQRSHKRVSYSKLTERIFIRSAYHENTSLLLLFEVIQYNSTSYFVAIIYITLAIGTTYCFYKWVNVHKKAREAISLVYYIYMVGSSSWSPHYFIALTYCQRSCWFAERIFFERIYIHV